MASFNVPLKLLRTTSCVPTKANFDDAGYDLYADVDFPVTVTTQALIDTGVSMLIPPGWYGRILPRSGLSINKSYDTGAGVIDSGYTGEIKVLVRCFDSNTPLVINRGDKIAQIVFQPCASVTFISTDTLIKTIRGSGGFGSSGN
jgi:dUTP pyrophosphatase